MHWTIIAACPKCGAAMKMNLGKGLSSTDKAWMRDFVLNGPPVIQGERIDGFGISHAVQRCPECQTVWFVDAYVNREKESLAVEKIYPSPFS